MIEQERSTLDAYRDAGYDINVKFVWAQGEGDIGTEKRALAYENNLLHFMQSVRTDLDLPDLEFYIWSVLDERQVQLPYAADVRASQERAVAADGNAKLFYPQGGELRPDLNHVTETSYFDLGEQMAADRLGDAYLPWTTRLTLNADAYSGTRDADVIFGRAGADRLLGGFGADILFGGNDVDYVAGHAGNDYLNGGYGDDTLEGGAGADVLFGSYGSDTVRFGNATGSINVNLYTGTGRLDIAQGDVYQLIENISGSAFKDVLCGDRHSNVIYGGAGNDNIYGREGNDTLNGNSGNDHFWAGTGVDALTAGGGSDTFHYRGIDNVRFERDTITGFGTGDVLSLENVTATFAQSGQDTLVTLFDHGVRDGEVLLFRISAAYVEAHTIYL